MNSENKFELIADLTEKYGEILGMDVLKKVIGYKTIAALKYAIREDRLGIKTFFINGRRGRFVMTRDVAEWMVNSRANNHDAIIRNNLKGSEI